MNDNLDQALGQLRNEIDRVDRRILELLNERYTFVKAVGRLKQEHNLPIYVPEREKALLAKLDECNAGPLPAATLHAIYREIISGARALEQPLRVAFLGPEGTFSHQAAINQFGHGVKYCVTGSIAEVFHAIECERADYGCVPVENSTEGAVNYTLDTLMRTNLNICGESNLPIHHCLLSNSAPSEIKTIYSHPQVLGQCRQYLLQHFPQAEQMALSSTTASARLVAETPGTAALANAMAAALFNVGILDENIEDISNNTTRFLMLGRQQPAPTGNDKTSLCFIVKDRPGALYDSLAPFKTAGLTLTMIESRPAKSNNWEYCFFIDLLGHRAERTIQAACRELEQRCSVFKILGSYPRAVDMNSSQA